ncbi:hypothetical protein NM208_g2880 [Fusarium decemcellulare]|uniref:Uncharacterized protein n=1 Tax=Fusarium decemcellulare TaxID=57161 RepID=A0ACC1SR40_9HYPO|nr:hypothetical protein NM208_g2880 [Fusarium decemcellulare]
MLEKANLTLACRLDRRDLEFPVPHKMADDSIANSVRRCHDSFRKLALLSLQSFDTSYQASLMVIAEEEARFKVWSGNIGAHNSGRRSLQYRLRDASHLQKQVLTLLGDLSELLEDALAILTGDRVPWDQLEDEATLADDTLSLDESSRDEELPATEIEQIASDVPDAVNCLLRLSVAIRNPAPHDRFATFVSIDASHYEQFDTQHVRDKFEHIDQSVAKRLGKAISRRRQYFKYRESHHLKLSHGLDNTEQKDSESTIASSLPGHVKAANINLSSIDEDVVSDSGVTQTSFASSNADTEKLRVPPLPKEAERGPFECPFCYMMITATSTISWKRHVFADLRPYVCLSENCTAAEREFARRHEWTLHEVQNHWKVYSCPCSCGENFQSRSKCKEHINKAHPGAISTSHLESMISLSARPAQVEDGISCPMCRDKLYSVKEYQRHVGRHQEQLALFALPSIQSQDDEENSRDESISSQIDAGSEEMSVADDGAGDLPISDNNTGGEIDSIPQDSRNADNDFLRNRVDIDIPTNEADTEISSRPPVIYSSNSRQNSATIDYGGDGYQYTNPAELARYDLDLDHPKTPSSHSHGNDASHDVVDDSIEGVPADNIRLDSSISPSDDLAKLADFKEESRHTVEQLREDVIGSSSEDPNQGSMVSPDHEVDEAKASKGILKAPKASFPEDPNPIREGVAPHKDDPKAKEAPEGAKWTKISRKVVDVEALTIGKERFEVRDDFVIVLRVLSKEEIQAYTYATQVLRERAQRESDDSKDRDEGID